jgi:hypothetical protein
LVVERFKTALKKNTTQLDVCKRNSNKDRVDLKEISA